MSKSNLYSPKSIAEKRDRERESRPVSCVYVEGKRTFWRSSQRQWRKWDLHRPEEEPKSKGGSWCQLWVREWPAWRSQWTPQGPKPSPESRADPLPPLPLLLLLLLYCFFLGLVVVGLELLFAAAADTAQNGPLALTVATTCPGVIVRRSNGRPFGGARWSNWEAKEVAKAEAMSNWANHRFDSIRFNSPHFACRSEAYHSSAYKSFIS